jgi:hypothetical protein
LPLTAGGIDCAASGGPSVSEQEGGEVAVAVGPSRLLPGAVAAKFDPAFLQAAGKPRTGYAKTDSDSLEWFSGDVCLDHVVEVRTFEAACHVYDLQTVDGIILASDSITDNGFIVTGNCQCTVISDFVGDELDAEVPDQYAQRRC